ncbi:MAG: insulinase family protein [Alphaproteobacteria bacterium]|nr:insulinase family protein [Alphaproteobacteria bacterium]MBU2379329.1 insulinase family protein [Alphaproteobacteria bacterium]
MKKMLLLASVAVMFGAAATASVAQIAPQEPALIPYEQFTLPNGLRVVVHEDHSAPKVAVAVWYHVGSMNEPEGKSGFAHLFEHLMFNGSEHHDDEYMPPLQEIGVSAVNGATSLDQTYYYEVVPTGGLERVLWLESDRMGYLLGAITQAKLDEQRGVVQNEKRTYENRPYSMMPQLRSEALYPANHPYHHSVIGSMDDLNDASLEDVREWFLRYYGASNAVVTLAGDVTVDQARELMTRYFASVPAGPPIGRMTDWTPQLERVRTEVVADNVPQTAIAWSWPVPGSGTEQSQALRMASSVLGYGRLSRLNQALVLDRQLATGVSASYESAAIAGVFTIDVRLKPGVERAEVETALQDVITQFLAEGPTAEELERVKITTYGNNVRSMEALFLRAMMLAGGTIFDDNPGQFQLDQEAFDALGADEVQTAANAWLSRPNYRLTVVPQGQFAASADTADRSRLPEMGPTPDLVLPPLEEGRLSNGMRVIYSHRQGTPTVDLVMAFNAGGAADQGMKEGIQGFTVGLMDDGTETMTGQEFAKAQEMLGARIYAYSDSDTTNFSVSALNRSFDDTIALWSGYIRDPGFRESDLERERATALSGLQQALVDPDSIAGSVFNYLIFGADHAYGAPLAGRSDMIGSYTRDDLVAFHQTYIRPDNAVIFAAGDAEFDTLMATLETNFGDWRAPAQPLAARTIASVVDQTTPRIVLVDKPGAIQSVIRVGQVAPTGLDPRNFDLGLLNGVLGGGFTARLNMNLREQKGWTYGANSRVGDAIGPQVFSVSTSVQTDRTAEALTEISRELHDIGGGRPVSERELELYRRGEVLTLPDQFETNNAMVGYLRYVARFDHSYDWITTLPERYAAATPETVTGAATMLAPDAMTWVVVGDLSKIEAGVRALELGEVEVWNAEGERQR